MSIALLLVLALGARSSSARVEAFLVEEPTADGPRPVAVATWRKLEREVGPLLELELKFRAGGTTVFFCEHEERDGWHALRRELRGPESSGRTSRLEPGARGALRTVSAGRAIAREASASSAPRLLLALLEDLRAERAVANRFALLDPESETLVEAELRMLPEDPRSPASGPTRSGARAPRTAELVRVDGSLIGRFVFEGAELVAFQWQAGARWARRVDLAEVDRLRSAWRIEHDPLAEVWAAVRAGEIQR